MRNQRCCPHDFTAIAQRSNERLHGFGGLQHSKWNHDQYVTGIQLGLGH
ncbi:MAG: hypothetical protein WCH60_03935 [Burkholderiales bacterium]